MEASVSSPTVSDTRSAITLEAFLRSVEKRAFGMARAALSDPEDALDVVQDAMLRLVKNYASRDAEQWRKLFYRILYNRIKDVHRYRALQRGFRSVVELRGTHQDADIEDRDPESLPTPCPAPEQQLEDQRNIQALVESIGKLPRRQREVFMLRNWEGMSTRESAQTLKITEGSVKTHYSRALTALRLDISR